MERELKEADHAIRREFHHRGRSGDWSEVGCTAVRIVRTVCGLSNCVLIAEMDGGRNRLAKQQIGRATNDRMIQVHFYFVLFTGSKENSI